MTIKLLCRALFALSALIAATATAATTARVQTAEDIRNELLKGRLDDSPGVRAPKGARTRQLSVVHRIRLTVTFRPGSSVLTREGEAQLAELARALQMPELAERRYLVAGHTDRSGNHRANQKLSEQRADSVRDYLLGQFEIGRDRLSTAGLGDTQPLPGISPFDPANRRVEITETP